MNLNDEITKLKEEQARLALKVSSMENIFEKYEREHSKQLERLINKVEQIQKIIWIAIGIFTFLQFVGLDRILHK